MVSVETNASEGAAGGLHEVIDDMTVSFSSVRELLRSLREKQSSTTEMDTREGISLLFLRSHAMLSYIQSLVLLIAHRSAGHSLSEREAPTLPFSNPQREARGAGAGDLVDSMIEKRVVLDKVKALEGRMRYQIEKLVRLAQEASQVGDNVLEDPLAFRPNPQALMDDASDEEVVEEEDKTQEDGGIYRPPKLAPTPYTETSGKRDKKAGRRPVPTALSNLAYLDASKPHAESTSGLGAAPAANLEMASQRARDLRRMTEFEEENFTRLVMKKKEARQRRRDEEDVALGGVPSVARGGRRRGGLEDEFGDVLRSVSRSRTSGVGDGYDELRQRGKKANVLERSRKRDVGVLESEGADEGPKFRKRSRFEKEAKAARKKINTKRK